MNDRGEETQLGLAWRLVRFRNLTGEEVYDILALRQRVFMLEQKIAVLDADGLDGEAWHLCGRAEEGLVAYARIFVPPDDDVLLKIGRIVVAEEVRGRGLGRELMEQALQCAAALAPQADVLISAQAHLAGFYEGFGFSARGEIYDDHGVAHVDMIRTSSPA